MQEEGPSGRPARTGLSGALALRPRREGARREEARESLLAEEAGGMSVFWH